MATPDDVVRELTKLTTAKATAIANAPTGVTPGYHAALGGTVDEAGRIRYVGASAEAQIWAAEQPTAQTIAPDARAVIDFDDVIQSPFNNPVPAIPYITTGAGAWAFTSHSYAGTLALVGIRVVVHGTGDIAETDFTPDDAFAVWWGKTGNDTTLGTPTYPLQLVDMHVVEAAVNPDESHGSGFVLTGTILSALTGEDTQCAYITYASGYGGAVNRRIGGLGIFRSAIWIKLL